MASLSNLIFSPEYLPFCVCSGEVRTPSCPPALHLFVGVLLSSNLEECACQFGYINHVFLSRFFSHRSSFSVCREWVKPKKAYEIVAGSRLQIGQSSCTVAISWER